MAARRSAILYQNAERDITLIDIPTSIAGAQGSNEVLLSSRPLAEPYPDTNAPKSGKAKAKCDNNTVDDELHAIYKAEMEKALSEIRLHAPDSWCLPRQIMDQVEKPSRPSEMEIDDPENTLSLQLREWSQSNDENADGDFQAMMAKLQLEAEGKKPFTNWVMAYTLNGKDAGIAEDADGSTEEPMRTCFHNEHKVPLTLAIRDSTSENRVYTFRIPPLASFYLRDVQDVLSFRTEFRAITEDYKLPRHFNFVLLDPPWPNHSARRKAAYAPQISNKAVKHMILKMDLDAYFDYDALVGIWITNKQSVRDLVLGEGGIFERLNLALIEEWIWVKTTVKGEPVTSVDSVWRKPYEVLLLGKAAPNSYTIMKPPDQIKRRVIVGVPDFHSRKPCLKELIEPYMPGPDYAALEVFARHLVSGWSSLGDEVLKFNYDGYWAASPQN